MKQPFCHRNQFTLTLPQHGFNMKENKYTSEEFMSILEEHGHDYLLNFLTSKLADNTTKDYKKVRSLVQKELVSRLNQNTGEIEWDLFYGSGQPIKKNMTFDESLGIEKIVFKFSFLFPRSYREAIMRDLIDDLNDMEEQNFPRTFQLLLVLHTLLTAYFSQIKSSLSDLYDRESRINKD